MAYEFRLFVFIIETTPMSMVDCLCHFDIDAEVGPFTNKDYTLVLTLDERTVLKQSFSYSSTLDMTFEVPFQK